MKKIEHLREHVNAADAGRQLLDTRRGIFFQRQRGFVGKLVKIVFSENGQLGWMNTKEEAKAQSIVQRFNDYQLGMAELAAAQLVAEIAEAETTESAQPVPAESQSTGPFLPHPDAPESAATDLLPQSASD